MGNRIKGVCALIFTFFLAVSTARAETTVFVNVNVVPMSNEEVLLQQTVVVDDGLIVTVGAVDLVPVPKGVAIWTIAFLYISIVFSISLFLKCFSNLCLF